MNCQIVADYARELSGDPLNTDIPSCIGDFDSGFFNVVQGQKFDTQGFNVIVAFANCNVPSSNGPGEQAG